MPLNQFICAYLPSHSNSDNYHYIIHRPIKLECNHIICQDCFDQNVTYKKVLICGKCAKKSSCFYSFLDDKSENSLSNNLNKIKSEIEIRFDYVLSDIKDKKEHFCAKIDYLKEEIDIKVESIKIELDKQADRLKNELEKIRNEVLRRMVSKKVFFSKSISFEADKIESNQQKFLNDLNEKQTKISQIKSALYELNAKLDVYEMNESLKPVEPFFGSKFSDTIMKTDKSNPKFVMSSVVDFCLLNNDGYCVLTKDSIEIYDEFCEVVNYKSFDRYILVDSKLFNVDFDRVLCDKDDNIYITNLKNPFILKLDKQLNMNKAVNIDAYVKVIHYYNDHLYLINANNKLTKWTTDLKLIGKHEILNANNHCFIQNTLCVANSHVYFYNIEPFEYKFQYDIDGQETIRCFNINNNFFIKYVQIFDEEYNYCLFDSQGKSISTMIPDGFEYEPSIFGHVQKRIEHNEKVFMAIKDIHTNYDQPSCVFIIT